MAAEQTWIGSDGRAAERRQRDSSDSDGSGENMDLWKRLRKDVRNSCDNMVLEKTWLDGSVRNSNGSDQTAETVAVQNWITGPGGSGGITVKKTMTVAEKTWLGSNGRAAARR